MAAGDKKQPLYGAESTISDQIALPTDEASNVVAITAIIAALEKFGMIKTNA